MKRNFFKLMGAAALLTLMVLAGCPDPNGGNNNNNNNNSVTVTSVTVTAADSAASVAKGGSLQFSAAVAGKNEPSQSVTWSITTSGKSYGTSISNDGLLTVSGSESNSTLEIKAVSDEDSTKSGTITVTVTKGIYNLEITAPPAKTEYRSGETLDTTGMIITVTYDDNTTGVITDYTMEITDGSGYKPIKNGDVISVESTGDITVVVQKGGSFYGLTLYVKAAIPANAEAAVFVDAKQGSYIPGYSPTTYMSSITITLNLPDGGEWIAAPEGGFTDEQKAAIKDWVSLDIGNTTPALSGWGCGVETYDYRPRELYITYEVWRSSFDGDKVTAAINADKLGEMKGYTNIPGSLTAGSPAEDANW